MTRINYNSLCIMYINYIVGIKYKIMHNAHDEQQPGRGTSIYVILMTGHAALNRNDTGIAMKRSGN